MSAAVAYGFALAAAGMLASRAAAVWARARTSSRLDLGGMEDVSRPGVDVRRAAPVAMVVAGAVAGYRLAGPVGGAALAAGVAAHHRARRRRRAEARRELLEAQLRDAVGAMAAASRAGLSLRRSLEEVLRDAEPPLRQVLEEGISRLEVGEGLDRALRPLSDVSPDGRLLVSVLSVHARVGGDLPGLLDELGSVLGLRLSGRREARALTAQARASGAVLAVLPIAFVGLLSGTSGAALGAFYRTARGSVLLSVGLLLQGFGFLWLRRIAGWGTR